MKSLLLLRHAKSLKGNPSLKDFDRPLNDIGLAQIPVVAENLKKQSPMPDYIVSSSSKRTTQTAQLLADQLHYKGEFKWLDELYEAECPDYIRVLKNLPDTSRHILLVGHNPTHEEFLYIITGQNELLSTGAVAIIELPINHWKELTERTVGKLISVIRPKELME